MTQAQPHTERTEGCLHTALGLVYKKLTCCHHRQRRCNPDARRQLGVLNEMALLLTRSWGVGCAIKGTCTPALRSQTDMLTAMQVGCQAGPRAARPCARRATARSSRARRAPPARPARPPCRPHARPLAAARPRAPARRRSAPPRASSPRPPAQPCARAPLSARARQRP